MSGAKRRTKYRKRVEDDVLYGEPEPEENQCIVVVVASRGGNLLEVCNDEGAKALCRLPTKFRKLIWVKRGTFLIVSRSDENGKFLTATGAQGKVVYTVEHVLFKAQIKHLKQKGLWPKAFGDDDAGDDGKAADGNLNGNNNNCNEEDADMLLFENKNRSRAEMLEDSTSEEEEESSDEEDA